MSWLFSPPGLILLGAIVTLGFWQLIHRLTPVTDPPIDIVAFEFAWSPEKVQDQLGAWGPEAAGYLRLSLVLDFGLIAGYTLFLASSCWAIGDYWGERSPAATHIGLWLGRLVIAAAIADVLENGALFLVLADPTSNFWPKAAAIFAGFKFFWLAIAFLFVLVGAPMSLAMPASK